MAFYSTKTYGHNIGLSAVFRQPNASHSHCQLLHGYSLGFKFTFACKTLDDKNWAVDFGGLKPLKKWLEDNFDHKVVLDENDPKHITSMY
jgi:6-pyruvoyltetrahydropterin/6-carboxytetrahydropterin synthase